MQKVDLNALKQLSNIELFLLLCGMITIASADRPTLVCASEPMPPQPFGNWSQRLSDAVPSLDSQA